MKDNKKRGVYNQGYKWLLVMDRSNSDCFKVFDLFLPLIDLEKDKVHGLTLLPNYVNVDDVKAPFYQKMEEINFVEGEQFTYISQKYKSQQSLWLQDYINHNEKDFYDFVIFLNNPQKYRTQGQECESFKYIKNICANICFCNYASLDGYDYKKISKLPSDVDERRFLDSLTSNSDIYTLNENNNKNINNVNVNEKKPSSKIDLLYDFGKAASEINLIKEEEKIDIPEEDNSEVIGVRKGEFFDASPAKKSNRKWDKDPKVPKVEPKRLDIGLNTMKIENTVPNSKKSNKVNPLGPRKSGGVGLISSSKGITRGLKKANTTRKVIPKAGLKAGKK